MSARERREERKNLARRRAETHSSGFEGTNIRIPDGLPIWAPKEGVYTIAIVPYVAKRGNPHCDPGDKYFERTFWQWARIGAGEGKSYCCLHKNFGKADPIVDWKAKEARNPHADQALLQSLNPKERQLFLVYDKKEEKMYLWECSYHLFGKLLDSRIQNADEDLGWDFFYDTDENGCWLRLTFTEQSAGGYSFLACSAIDFVKRTTPLPSEISEHTFCLDDLLVEKSYQELKNIFLGVSATESEEEPESKPAPKTESKPAPKTESKPAPKTESKPAVVPVVGDLVEYKGNSCRVLKKTGDTLMLEDEKNDKILRNISIDDVVISENKTPFESEERSSPESGKSSSAFANSKNDDDDDWAWDK